MAAPISIVNGEYRINGGAWTSSIGTIANSDTLQVRRTSSDEFETEVLTTVTVGAYSTSFSITTKDNIIACGVGASFSGGEAFPTEYIVTLGSDTGDVELYFNSFGIPDKFIVIYDGVEVIDTGYRGDTSYQSALDAELASRSLPPETITSPPNGTATFTKSTASPTTAIVRVFAPLSGTAWNFNLGCPEVPLFGNVLIDENYQKNDCEEGVGSMVPVEIPANEYYAATQEEADALAEAAAQAFANANGSCEIIPTDLIATLNGYKTDNGVNEQYGFTLSVPQSITGAISLTFNCVYDGGTYGSTIILNLGDTFVDTGIVITNGTLGGNITSLLRTGGSPAPSSTVTLTMGGTRTLVYNITF